MRVSRELTRETRVWKFSHSSGARTQCRKDVLASYWMPPSGSFSLYFPPPFFFSLSLSLFLSLNLLILSRCFCWNVPYKTLLATTISLCSVNFVESFLRRDKKTWWSRVKGKVSHQVG